MTHTPTPWMATKGLHGKYVVVCTEADPRVDIVKTYEPGLSVPVNENALFIVKAANCHDELAKAILAVVAATRAYLPPDGIDAQECLNRILAATDNPAINPIIRDLEATPTPGN